MFEQIDVADVFSGRIFATHKVISEDSDLNLRCSILGADKQYQHYIYLCKDGVGILKKKQKLGEPEIRLTVQHVSQSHSGSYSCVYSKSDYLISQISASGEKAIEILVVGECLSPADRICVE